jgi:hypothetical protein
MKLKINLLLWNYWANLNQTLLKWFLDGPLPKLCPVIPTSNQDGRQAMSDINLEGNHPRTISAKFGWDWLSSFRGEDFFLISSPFFLICIMSLGGPLSNLCPSAPSCIQDGHHY